MRRRVGGAAAGWLAAALLAGPAAVAATPGLGYAAPGAQAVQILEHLFDDPARARSLPVRLRVPGPCTADDPRPVVLFSHGLGGSRDAGARWGAHWASHGFVVVHLQHPGSDESLWRGQPGGLRRLDNLRPGMTPQRFVERTQDVRFVLDELARRAVTEPGLGCVDTGRVGMSGHSFGAQTTQAVAGQSYPAVGGPVLREPRVVAAVAFSPSRPPESRQSAAVFDTLTIPFLGITGSRDGDVVGSGVTPALRRGVVDALPAGQAYLLWFEGADHFVFDGGTVAVGADPADHARLERATRAVTLAFWLATLRGDAQAARWLRSDGPGSLLGPGDLWIAR